MLYGAGTIREIQSLKVILDLFYSTTGMELNNRKSYNRVNEMEALVEAKEQLEILFPFEASNLDVEIKYVEIKLGPLPK
jgi:hypothetical protein